VSTRVDHGRPVTHEDGWGRTVRGRHRRRRLRLVVVVLVVLLVALLAVPVWVASRVPRIPVTDLAGSGTPLTILVVGSDSRADLTADQRRELTTGGDEGDRTDTIFLMSVRGADAAILAFPRDLFVERCDGSVGRINAAQAIGGPGCLVRTIRDLSGIDVHHYVRVTFGGFVDVVDAVGGVDLCLEEPISDRDAGIDLPAGCQTLGGPDALGYVRVRKIDDDLQRIQRQQRFLRALANEVAAPSTLLNPVRMYRLGEEAGEAVAVDDGAGVIALSRMALGGTALARGTAVSYTVPGDPRRTAGGADVLDVREAEAEALFARFRDGSVLRERPGEEDAVPDRSAVRVSVLNGAGVAGLAGSVGELLTGRGFEVVDVGNADARDRSVVRYPPGQEAAAALVAGDVPGSPPTEQDNAVAVVTVVLGRDAVGAS
jgi:LCP family protein required for cell wall assembly